MNENCIFQALILPCSVGPTLLFLSLTIILDIKIHCYIRNMLTTTSMVSKDEKERRNREKIPKRATIINSFFLIPWVLYAIFHMIQNHMLYDLSTETKSIVLDLPNLIVNSVRNPIIAHFAFKVNAEIQKETVKSRRLSEIEEALKNREKRLNSRDSVNPSSPVPV